MRIRTECVWMLLVLLSGFPASTSLAQDFGDMFERIEAPWVQFPNRARDGSLRFEGPDNETTEEEPLETDRDSFTPATTTVNSGRVLFESSYSFIQNRTSPSTHSFPEVLTRFGVTERLEFRLGWNYEVGGGGDVSNGNAGGELDSPGSKQESQILYGFKLGVTKQQGLIPASAAIVQSATPTSGVKNTSDLQLGYVFGWKFLDDWQLDSSIRYITTKEEGDNFSQWAPSVVLKVPVAERWSLHGEYFGIFADGRAQGVNPQFFSPGVHYLLTPDCEVGVRLGWGLNHDAANFFSNVGLGLRF